MAYNISSYGENPCNSCDGMLYLHWDTESSELLTNLSYFGLPLSLGRLPKEQMSSPVSKNGWILMGNCSTIASHAQDKERKKENTFPQRFFSSFQGVHFRGAFLTDWHSLIFSVGIATLRDAVIYIWILLLSNGASRLFLVVVAL